MSFWDFLGKKKEKNQPLFVDMHSHVLPGIDDGAATMEDSIDLIKKFNSLGYKKVICTPHSMGEGYINDKKKILDSFDALQQKVLEQNIPIALGVSAEYYLDEHFLAQLKSPELLLPINDKYILFETAFLNASSLIDEAIFEIQSLGYTPILAHPERYLYMQTEKEWYERLIKKNVLFQLNINSLTGYYNKGALEAAKYLIKNKYVHFLGSDSHKVRHMEGLSKAFDSNLFQDVVKLPIQNNNL